MALTRHLVAIFAIFVLGMCAIQTSGLRLPHPRLPIPGLVISDLEDTEKVTVPLKDVSVDVEMIDSIAKVTLTQIYKNDRTVPLRVNYVFPLDDRAAITSFLAEFPNGRKLIGVSKERATAREEFEEAVAAGHSAVLLDQESSDVFKAEIGNLGVGEDVKITIAYITQVPQESQSFRFTLPTVLAPRYRSSTSEPPTSHAELPYSLTFDMSISMTGIIESISSPTHEIRSTLATPTSTQSTSTRTGTPSSGSLHSSSAKVYLQGDLDGDFVVVVRLAEAPKESSIIVEVDNTQPEGTAIALNLRPLDFILLPPAALDDGLIELYFIVDVSGSMYGDKMEDTKRAMQAAMQQLRDEKRGVLFNVIPFSTHFQPLFDTAQPLNDETFQQAIRLIETLRAGGGTEILEPLQFAVTRPLLPNRQRRVIVLTDGLVGNTNQVFQLVKAHSALTQIFPVGIGNGVSHALVNGLATHGLGVSEYVVLGEQVSEKMARQLERALSSTALNLKLSFLGHDGKPIESGIIQSPQHLPPLYSESDVRVLALISKAVKSIVVTIPETGLSREFLLANYKQVRSDIIHKMCAKAQIRDLELMLESDEESAQNEEIKVELRAKIAQIATSYNLMSSQTSFVAVDPDSAQFSKPLTVSVPAMPERGTFAKSGGYMRTMAAMPSMQSNSYGGAVYSMDQAPSDAGIKSQVMEMPKPEIIFDEDTVPSGESPAPNSNDIAQNANNTEDGSEAGWLKILTMIFEFIIELLT